MLSTNKFLTFGAVALLGACQPQPADVRAAEPMPLTTAAAFNAAVADRPYALGDIRLTIRSDGTLDGTFNGVPLRGNWEFRDGQWCRTLTEGGSAAARTECQTMVLMPGGDVVVTRPDGRSFTYTPV